MATDARVRRLRAQVQRMHGAKEMKAAQAKGLANDAALQVYYDAYDKFDDVLSQYYAAKIMLMKIKHPDLFDLYIDMPKQQAKDKMLRQITRVKDSDLSHQLNIKRISDLKQLIKESKSKLKKAALRKSLQRMERWAGDLNY